MSGVGRPIGGESPKSPVSAAAWRFLHNFVFTNTYHREYKRPSNGPLIEAIYTFPMGMDNQKNLAKVFSRNLIAYRKQKGLSQYDLANATGISRSMISHYEREGILPPIDRLQAVADILDIPVSRLFEENAPGTNRSADLSGVDPRSVKKLRDILSLSSEDRNDLYRILNKMLRKKQLEQQNLASTKHGTAT
jgi:transcriptional regulator with XRE-family HTH domain